MEFIEYSLESLRDESVRLAEMVERDGYRPDCVAYLARGGWLIGKEISEYFGTPLIELSAHRSGDAAKESTAPFLSSIPRPIRKIMRSLEIKRRLAHDDGTTQKKTVHLTSRYRIPAKVNQLLLVDDSADTGVSIVAASSVLAAKFPGATVKVAVINAFNKAMETARLDWCLHKECLLGLPSSKDSKEYGRFTALYDAKDL